jgi:hypothetical protein
MQSHFTQALREAAANPEVIEALRREVTRAKRANRAESKRTTVEDIERFLYYALQNTPTHDQPEFDRRVIRVLQHMAKPCVEADEQSKIPFPQGSSGRTKKKARRGKRNPNRKRRRS